MGLRYAEPRPTEPAKVHYARIVGNRREKLAVLDRIQRLEDQSWHLASRAWQAPLTPRAASAYMTWPKLTDIFPWQLSGAQLKRTWPIGPTPTSLPFMVAGPCGERVKSLAGSVSAAPATRTATSSSL